MSSFIRSLATLAVCVLALGCPSSEQEVPKSSKPRGRAPLSVSVSEAQEIRKARRLGVKIRTLMERYKHGQKTIEAILQENEKGPRSLD